MIDAVREEVVHLLSNSLAILQTKESHDTEALKELSEHSIEYIAMHKDLELVSVTVLIYSFYKIESCLKEQDRTKVVTELTTAISSLKKKQFGRYNNSLKLLYTIVSNCNERIKEHLQDVMDAARIKKGTSLLQHGLSIGQAAGLMGLSNWDLQAYSGRANLLHDHKEVISARQRLLTAFKLFDLK